MRDSHALRQLRGKRLVCSAGVGVKSDMLMHDSCDYNQRYKKNVSKFCVPTSENLSDTFTKSLSQADADRCYRCTNYHMRKHMSPKNTESVTNLNELQTISDASGNSEA